MNGPPVVDLALSGVKRGDQTVLGAVSLRVARGETVALTGPSGIGKTTLLRVIAGLESCDGTCRVTGRLACVFQEPALLPWRSLTDNIRLATGVSADVAATALQSVGLGRRGDVFPGQLSLGQQRRVALARAFAVPPDLLLLDEPFVSLDPNLAEQMMDLLRDLIARHRPATLLVTHSAIEAEGLAQRILRLGGSPATLV